MGSATVRYGILVPTAATLLLSAGTVYAYGGPGTGGNVPSVGSGQRYESSSPARSDDVESVDDAIADVNLFLDRADSDPGGSRNGLRAHTQADAAGRTTCATPALHDAATSSSEIGGARVRHNELRANGWRGPPSSPSTIR